MTTTTESLRHGLSHDDSSVRLRAALAAGTRPEPEFVQILIAQCAIEPDFYVRDMLTWALLRQPAELTVPELLIELHSDIDQARSQALHSLSKIGDARAWPAITPALLRDGNDEVARAAWRAAVILVPDTDRPELAATLATQLGRGAREVQLSLSRALVALGDVALGPLQTAAVSSANEAAQAHASATERMMSNPDEGFDAALFEAKRALALKDAPIPSEEPD